MSINNPHDAFFKEVFQDKENLADIIKGCFPLELKRNLDLSTLDLDNSSYMDEELKELFSDIVYNCTYKGDMNIKISLLFEHKSYKPAYPELQILKYILKIWETGIKQEKRIMPVIPVVLYHGTERWEQKRCRDYFKGIDEYLAQYVVDINYLLIDLSNYSDEELKSEIFEKVSTEIALLIMKNIFREEILLRYLEDFLKIGKLYYEESKGLRFLESVIRYIYSATKIDSALVIEKVKKVSQRGGELAMTTAMKLKEEGKKEGINEGIREARREAVINLYTEEKWEFNKIARVLNVEPDFVKATIQEKG